MKRKTPELKALARTALKGHYPLFIGTMILLSICYGVMSMLSLNLFQGNSIFSFVMSQIFSIVLSLIVSIFSTGIFYMYLRIARGEEANYGDIFYMFHHHPDRVIIVGFVLVVIQSVIMIPYDVYAYRSTMSMNADTATQVLLSMIGLLCIGLLIVGLVTLPFTLCYYLLVDDDQLGAMEAIKLSASMMKGNYGRYIYLQLSFVGLMILGICSCNIGLLWVGPYLQMTQAQFYRELRGELDVRPETSTDTTSEIREEISLQPEPPKDDYNAEA